MFVHYAFLNGCVRRNRRMSHVQEEKIATLLFHEDDAGVLNVTVAFCKASDPWNLENARPRLFGRLKTRLKRSWFDPIKKKEIQRHDERLFVGAGHEAIRKALPQAIHDFLAFSFPIGYARIDDPEPQIVEAVRGFYFHRTRKLEAQQAAAEPATEQAQELVTA
jgi:hypothetical protein